MKKSIRAPAHLSNESKKLWREIVGEYSISDAAGLKILAVALGALDRAEAARQAIGEEGMTILDRNGVLKPHPLLCVERDSRAGFLAGLKALNLDWEPLHDRPGRPGGRR